jgi:hypothetical protein
MRNLLTLLLGGQGLFVKQGRPHRRFLILIAFLAIGELASADTDLPYVKFQDNTELESSCREILDEAKLLLPHARMCKTHSDCDHFPCSCGAIGTHDQAQHYRDLVTSLQSNCGASIIYAYCGRTVAVCEAGQCKARSVPERPK